MGACMGWVKRCYVLCSMRNPVVTHQMEVAMYADELDPTGIKRARHDLGKAWVVIDRIRNHDDWTPDGCRDRALDAIGWNRIDYDTAIGVYGVLTAGMTEPQALQVHNQFVAAMNVAGMVEQVGVKPPTEVEPDLGDCRWFIHCTRDATHLEYHPILGWVAACDRCPKVGDPQL